jgi:hypothetical protein
MPESKRFQWRDIFTLINTLLAIGGIIYTTESHNLELETSRAFLVSTKLELADDWTFDTSHDDQKPLQLYLTIENKGKLPSSTVILESPMTVNYTADPKAPDSGPRFREYFNVKDWRVVIEPLSPGESRSYNRIVGTPIPTAKSLIGKQNFMKNVDSILFQPILNYQDSTGSHADRPCFGRNVDSNGTHPAGIIYPCNLNPKGIVDIP